MKKSEAGSICGHLPDRFMVALNVHVQLGEDTVHMDVQFTRSR